MLGLADGGLVGGTISRQVVPLNRLHRELKQSHHPNQDWRKTLPVSYAGEYGNVATCWSFVQNSV